MSTVGLTKAMREALENPGREGTAYKRAVAAGFLVTGKVFYEGFGWGEGLKLTPRGHAALAAPRMTKAELCSLEGVEINGICFAKAGLNKGWIERDSDYSPWRLTPAGRTALNNVRAAMGSPDWKEGL